MRLEELARRLPCPIRLRSRTKKLQRFLSLKQFNPKQLWFPFIKSWVDKMTKTKGFSGLNLAAKWKRDDWGKSSKEAWFLLTNLESLSAATNAYSKRMGIEEMFRDFKSGGYSMEDTQVNNERLIAVILLLTLAYSWSGEIVKQKGVAKSVTRPTEAKRVDKRHSDFSIGLNSITWLNSLAFFQELTQELLSFYPHKQPDYRQGMRAASLIRSAF